MRRGELYRVRRPGGDVRRSRVFVVVSRQALIDSRFATVVCAPVYTQGEGLSTQVLVGTEDGLKHPSWLTCDNLVSLPKSRLTDYVGALSRPSIKEMNRALRAALDLL
ncbi:MAG: type II toxin-antitoxin system PemK/MazF family toxin [Longimicrobiales bacterium]